MAERAAAEELVLLRREEGVGTLVLNRPEKLNAFIGRMRDRIADGLAELSADPEIRVIVVTGAGRAFCAGADVGYLARLLEEEEIEEARALAEAGCRVVRTILEAPQPVIAAVNGPAVGGGANLALACDLRIASDRASIGQTFNRIGLVPDWGGSYFLPRLVGPSRAMELVFLAELVEAERAGRLGLFDRVVPHEELEAEVARVAETLAAKPPLALELAKRAIRRSLGASLEEMLRREVDDQERCFRSEDAREGMRAFLEKREPRFGGPP